MGRVVIRMRQRQTETATAGPWRWLLAVALAGLLVAPAGLAGTQDAPEIVDERGDAQVLGSAAGEADIVKAWIEEDGDRLTFTIEVDALGPAEQVRAAALGTAWAVEFSEDGTAWAVVAQAAVPEPSTDDPALPSEATALGGHVEREGTTVEAATVEAHIDEERFVVISWTNFKGYLPAGERLTELHAHTRVEHASMDNSVECHGEDVVDCGPDEGFGDDFRLSGERPRAAIRGVEVLADRGERDVRAGEEVSYALDLRNPTDDTVEVVLDETAPDAWNPEFDRDTVTLEPGESASNRLVLRVPADESDGRVAFSIILESGDETARLDLVADVADAADGPFAVEVTPEAQERRVDPGATATYEVTVKNDGSREDDYNVTVSGARQAWVTVSDYDIELAPGESRTLTVDVDVPDDAKEGVYTHRLRVTSQTDPAVRDTADMSTNVHKGAGIAAGDVAIPGVGTVSWTVIGIGLVVVAALAFLAGRGLGGRKAERETEEGEAES